MLVNPEKYIWTKWQQQVYDSNKTWGEVAASSVRDEAESGICYEPYFALDGNSKTYYEAEEQITPVQFVWRFEKPLKIYRIELVNINSEDLDITKNVEVYADEEMTVLLCTGEFPEQSAGICDMEPETPVSCDGIVLQLSAMNHYVGLASIQIIAEVGEEKTVLLPFLNTAEGMEAVSSSYNDDGTFTCAGMKDFLFNGIVADPLYISSNHWIGFGANSEQLRILRRDGCSTAIYRQAGQTGNGLDFLKIRFEGYTVYNNRVEENRLIFELFLLSNHDMFLNIIQTPTSGNTGSSQLICNKATTELTLFDGSGGGAFVSFYHEDTEGKNWNIQYAMYEDEDTFSFAYLLRQQEAYFTLNEGVLEEAPITNLTAAMFLKYGFEVLPPSESLTALANPQIYLWKAGGEEKLLKATVKAYPYPSAITSVVNMSHISILGIRMMTAEYSGKVGLLYSLDGGETFSEELPLGDWINTDPDALWESLGENRILVLRFMLHDNAALSRFKITYIN